MRHILLFQKRNLPGVCVYLCVCVGVGVCGGMHSSKPEGKISSTVCVQVWLCRCLGCVCVGVAMYSVKPEGKISSTECPENF